MINNNQCTENINAIKRILQRERIARKKAEEVIEEKSMELYNLNQELITANHSLEEKVKARTLELQQTLSDLQNLNQELTLAKEKAEQANKAKDNFLATMSHEIRTPLNAVIGISYRLLQDDPKTEQLPNLETLRFSSENLLSLINDILDYNKMEANKLDLEEIPFNIQSQAQKVKDAWGIKAKEKGIRLKCLIDSEADKMVLGDPTRLSQVLNNLIGNALKFTEEGNITLAVNVTDEDKSHLFVEFEVKDTGIGIPQSKLDSIFDRFTQADNSTSRKYGGSGLGLTISNKILKLYGSKLKVESEADKGTTFSFIIAFQKAALEERQQEFASKDVPLEGKSVLVVEDNNVNQQLVEWFLNEWGCKIDFADTGKMALEKVHENQYDFILMDLQMPGMDGFETTEAVRKSSNKNIETPILALTATAMMGGVRSQIYDAGMNGIVSKPFKPDELLTVIQKALSSI
ncbi:ATP-binding protein [Limibacter armeniacum]|uniref:ATP-binding protein n=1 Tax=Limibacter armeniacum TaxID=466084 RepID=UPI002FE6437F